MKITTATFRDLAIMAKCHMQAFPKALSSRMGQKYVEKMLEWYLVDNRTFAFLIKENNQCLGYCGGLVFEGASVGSTSSMIQYSFGPAVKAMLSRPWLLMHKDFLTKYKLVIKNIVRRFKTAFGLKKKTANTIQKQIEPHTGLIVIGVHPAFQGKGIGSMLLQEFEQISLNKNYKKMKLSVRTDNLKAIKSYRRNGWVITDIKGNSTLMEKRIAQ